MALTFDRPLPLLLADIRAGHQRLAGLLQDLTEEQARGDSELDGWTRGHVLTHIENLGRAFARQTEYATENRTIEVYEGGRPERDAGIEAGASRPAAELRAGVLDVITTLDRLWAAAHESLWQRPVRYRDGVLRDIAFCWWREMEIHTVDLALGYRPASWTPELCAHLTEFLASRVPPGAEVTGASTDVVAWMAGRRTDGSLQATTSELPVLGPWP